MTTTPRHGPMTDTNAGGSGGTGPEADRILVVDDEATVRAGCERILAAEGYEVETAEDGVAALERFAAGRRYSAALVDLKMPRLGGIDLIERIRRLDEDVLILVITGYATIETAVEATKRGAYGYIPKPFTPDELLGPVRQGLEHRALLVEAKQLRAERERRLLEVAFERSKSHTIIHCMTDAVIVVNREGQVVLRNAAACRVLPAFGRLPLPAMLEGALECEALRDLVAEVLTAAERPIIASREIALGDSTFMVNASPVAEPGGEALGAVAVLRDITPLKKLEEAKSTFVQMVAHEVKNPLAAIEGYLNVILSGAAGPDAARDRAMLERAMERARNLRLLVTELLHLSAIDAGGLSLKRAPLDLRAIAADVLEGLRERAAEKTIALAGPQPPGEPAVVLADEGAVRTILANLVDNAIKYTPAGGRVAVRVEPDSVHVRLVVEDTGIGMAPEEKGRVFEEFYRVRSKETAAVPGTGLGLTLVKRLVELHHGRVSVETAPGKGSRFTVSLPAVQDD